MERIRDAFFMIKDCKDDTQQRGWAVHDDHHIISGYLSELLQLLVRTIPFCVSNRVTSAVFYLPTIDLVGYVFPLPFPPLLFPLPTFLPISILTLSPSLLSPPSPISV